MKTPILMIVYIGINSKYEVVVDDLERDTNRKNLMNASNFVV